LEPLDASNIVLANLSTRPNGRKFGMKIHFLGSQKAAAQRAVQDLVELYGQAELTEAAIICAVGGDGTMLNALYTARAFNGKPMYGMRLPDSVGALGNAFQIADLDDRLQKARPIPVYPLMAEVRTLEGDTFTCLAINEIVLSRMHLQAAKLSLTIEGLWSGRGLIGDGLLVSTAIGSGGYNLAVGGPLLSWTSDLLALTAIAVRPSSEWCNTVVGGRTAIEVALIPNIGQYDWRRISKRSPGSATCA
jgi:NAD+ kinase